jgi:predicted phosphodiesterase
VRTLVISDLHLGTRAGSDVLQRPAPRARLLDALDGIDRLVLLGDVLELVTRHPWAELAAAEPVLRAIGRRMGPGREILVVPGNHDAALVRAWVRAHRPWLEPDTRVDPAASPVLTRMLSWLEPAQTSVHYPGAWLATGVWATHGHYLDPHLLPESAFGLPRGRLRGPAGHAGIADYERPRRRRRHSRHATLDRLLARPLATVLEMGIDLLRAATVPWVPLALKELRLAPLTATLMDLQMRHGAVPAIERVARRLGVEADWVVFGHVHRRGPMEGEEWAAGPGGMRTINPGSWLYEPLLLDRARPPHPYWPGGAVLLEPGRKPRTIGLLDDFSAAELQGRPSPAGRLSAA